MNYFGAHIPIIIGIPPHIIIIGAPIIIMLFIISQRCLSSSIK